MDHSIIAESKDTFMGYTIPRNLEAQLYFKQEDIMTKLDQIEKEIEKTLIKGRAPKYDNEFAITQIAADEYGLNIGDEVTLSSQEKGEKYLITGLYQSSTELGMCISMSYNAYCTRTKYILPAISAFLKI